MKLSVNCLECAATFRVPAELAGKKAKCSKCGARIIIPAPEPEDPEDLFGGLTSEDLYGDEIADPVVPSPRSASKAKPKGKPKAEKPAGRISLPVFFGGLFLCGILLSLGMIAVMGAFSGEDAPESPTASIAEIESREFADTDQIVATLGGVLDEMESLLKAGKVRQFVVQYAPLKNLRQLKEAELAKSSVAPIPLAQLLETIKHVRGAEPEVLENGWAVALSEDVILDGDDVSNREGYGAELDTVLDQSVNDLEQGNYEQFARCMLPQTVRLQLKTGESGAGEFLEQNPGLVAFLLNDLRAMQVTKPVVNGTVAEFRLPEAVTPSDKYPAIVRSSGTVRKTERDVSLSLIDGSWRLPDQLGEFGITSEVSYRLTFERVGNQWRLQVWP